MEDYLHRDYYNIPRLELGVNCGALMRVGMMIFLLKFN